MDLRRLRHYKNRRMPRAAINEPQRTHRESSKKHLPAFAPPCPLWLFSPMPALLRALAGWSHRGHHLVELVTQCIKLLAEPIAVALGAGHRWLNALHARRGQVDRQCLLDLVVV